MKLRCRDARAESTRGIADRSSLNAVIAILSHATRIQLSSLAHASAPAGGPQ